MSFICNIVFQYFASWNIIFTYIITTTLFILAEEKLFQQICRRVVVPTVKILLHACRYEMALKKVIADLSDVYKQKE